MITNRFIPFWATFSLALSGFLIVSGCSKKSATPAAAPPQVENAAAAPAPAPAATVTPSTDTQKSFAEADAALRIKAYDKAAQALLAAQQQKNLSEQQAQEARNRMIGLQQNLAAAIAAGDANAKAAAEMIRQAHMVH